MASRRKERQAGVEFEIMRLIENSKDISTRKIATQLRISNGSAFYILSALVKKGLVKLDNFNKNPHKGEYVYLLTPKGLRKKALLTYKFVEMKRREYEKLRLDIEVLEKEIILANKKVKDG